MKAEQLRAVDIKVGDIIYITLDEFRNEHLLGDDISLILAGSDVIVIIDDYIEEDSESIEFLINGGHSIFIEKDEVIYKLGHYSSLIQTL